MAHEFADDVEALKKVRAAKDSLKTVLTGEKWLQGIGIGRLGEEDCVVVNITDEQYRNQVPGYSGSVQVDVRVVGEVVLRDE